MPGGEVSDQFAVEMFACLIGDAAAKSRFRVVLFYGYKREDLYAGQTARTCPRSTANHTVLAQQTFARFKDEGNSYHL